MADHEEIPLRSEFLRRWDEFEAARPAGIRWVFPLMLVAFGVAGLLNLLAITPGSRPSKAVVGTLLVAVFSGFFVVYVEEKLRAAEFPVTRCPHCRATLLQEGQTGRHSGLCPECGGRIWRDEPCPVEDRRTPLSKMLDESIRRSRRS